MSAYKYIYTGRHLGSEEGLSADVLQAFGLVDFGIFLTVDVPVGRSGGEEVRVSFWVWPHLDLQQLCHVKDRATRWPSSVKDSSVR